MLVQSFLPSLFCFQLQKCTCLGFSVLYELPVVNRTDVLPMAGNSSRVSWYNHNTNFEIQSRKHKQPLNISNILFTGFLFFKKLKGGGGARL